MGESVVLGVSELGWIIGRSSGRRGRHLEGGVLAGVFGAMLSMTNVHLLPTASAERCTAGAATTTAILRKSEIPEITIQIGLLMRVDFATLNDVDKAFLFEFDNVASEEKFRKFASNRSHTRRQRLKCYSSHSTKGRNGGTSAGRKVS